MNKKYFDFIEAKPLDKDTINKIREEKEATKRAAEEHSFQKNTAKLKEEDSLIHVPGRVVVKINLDGKNTHTFENGIVIRRERKFNNFNLREVNPVNAIVISGEGIEKNAEVLIHQSAIHDSNRIFNYKDSNDDIKYYAIQNDMCFAWHDGNDWRPLPPYDFALRVFKPYEGLIEGIEPTQLKDTLFVTTGELKGKVVRTLIACDFEIVFQDRNGREGSIIRFRPFGDEKNKREEEAIAILNYETEKVLNGEYLVGVNLKDAKQFKKT